MFVAFLFIPVVAGNVFMEDSIGNVPEITERQSTWTKDYTIFDPCNTNKPGNRTRNCSQKKRRDNSPSGIYEIYIRDDPVNVTCDMDSDGGGWTVIQSRTEKEGGEDFFEKGDEEYKLGFGTIGGGFWIGLENLHALTSFPNNQQSLRIELTRSEGRRRTKVVHYQKFYVGSAKEKYKLTIDGYNGDGGYDALSHHNESVFTVKNSSKVKPDKDDKDECHKKRLSGGWWFTKCNRANLNGRKLFVYSQTKPLGITWLIDGDMNSYYLTYHKVEMKIRDADFGFCTGRQKS